MYFRQFRIADMGCASYMIGSDGECLVVDPQWDVEPYLRVAKKEGLKITYIIDTHVHADHVSGNRRLAERTGANILLHSASRAGYAYQKVEDGQVISIGKVRVAIMNTPGHTPESIMLKVTDLEQPDLPPYLLTGDTIFVGDVGRPDLAGTEGAVQLYQSLHQILPVLPTTSQIFPAHLAGSLCGRNLSTAHSSTLEVELRSNPALQIEDQDKFVHYLMDDLPPKPADFERIIGINRQGAPISQVVPKQLSPTQALELINGQGCKLVDTREPEQYWQKHVTPSLNVPVFSNQFGPNVINFIPPTTDLILVTDDEEDANEAVKLLAGVGRTNVKGYVLTGEALAADSGFKLEKARQVETDDLRNRPVVDVRETNEFESGTLEGALNLPLRSVNRPESLEKLRKLAGQTDFLVLICNNGQRSSIAASYLEEQGITGRNLANGLESVKETGAILTPLA
ncbi:MAG TPA: MBL fold metallo-hydrolase [Chloroflexia bacterium]|nr:MBL fold metallo-hydrolase [Chloroflexia bacterium]